MLSTLLRLYKHPCQGCVQSEVLSGNQKTKSAILFKLLTQTIEAPKKRKDCQSDKTDLFYYIAPSNPDLYPRKTGAKLVKNKFKP